MGDVFKGDERAPRVGTTAEKGAGAFASNFPWLSSTVARSVPFTERSLFNLQNELSPQEQALQAQLYELYAPRYAGVEREADTAATREASKVGLENILGTGGQGVLASEGIARAIDPEYYKLRQESANKLSELLQGGLTGGESTAIERGLNRSFQERGVANNPSNTDQFQAAAEYGGAARDRLGQALAAATSALPGFKTANQGDIYQQARGERVQGNTQGFGGNYLRNVKDTAQGLGQFGSSYLSGLQGQQNVQSQVNANRRTVADQVGQAWQQSGLGSATGAAAGGACCFIFLESYNGRLPWFVRYWRDRLYEKDQEVAKGYKRLAKILVPLMERSRTITNLVNMFMVNPITQYGGYLSFVKGFEHGKYKLKYFKFWMKFWKFLGSI